MKTGKFTLENSPYIFNVFRNGNIWIKGFNELPSALRYCKCYADSHDDYFELWQGFGNRTFRLIKYWN